MIEWFFALMMVVGFVLLIQPCGLMKNSKSVVELSRRSMAIIADRQMADEMKERLLQENAKRLLGLGARVAFGGAVAALAPMGMVWLFSRLGWVAFASVCETAVSPAFILVSCTIAVAAQYLLWRLFRKKKSTNYPILDRILHRVAFRSVAAQMAIADMEDRIHARDLAECKEDRPVFITALPRAGTTMLLELCARSGEFASHSYRDMPFVFIPCFWNRFAGCFKKECQPQERAHGDGMLIDFNSPEALEETLWAAFWKRHYRTDRIIPWESDEEDGEYFQAFFRNHTRKIRLVRSGKDAAASRYLSKNNLNIARISLLRRLFPQSTIIVPFREPLQHAHSLLKQHRNFLRIHEEDAFASEYMRTIGHYDFGKNLRPVDFDGWLDKREHEDDQSLGFWLEYWVASYRYLLRKTREVSFVDYDALCANSEREMQRISDILGCRDPETLRVAARKIHAANFKAVDVDGVSARVLCEVKDTYAELVAITGDTMPTAMLWGECVPGIAAATL